MLTFQLGKHLVHALAFSPDSARLAVASGRKLAVVDWRAAGVPAWREPPPDVGGRVTTLSFGRDGVNVLAGYGASPLLTLDAATGEFSDTFRGFVGSRFVLMSQPTVVIDASDPPVALTCGFAGLPRPAEVFALPSSGGLPLARLNLVGDPNSPDTVRRANYPLFAWVVRHNRLLVWSEGFLRWLRWPPPPPSPPPSRWRAFASAVTGVRPLPPDLDLLAEYPFPYLADAVAPLPDGDTVLVASKGAMIRWHAPTSTEQARWRWPGMQALRSLAVSPDGTVAAAGGNGGRVIVWDLDV